MLYYSAANLHKIIVLICVIVFYKAKKNSYRSKSFFSIMIGEIF